MDVRYFMSIAARLDKPKDERLSYTTQVRPTYVQVPKDWPTDAGQIVEGSTQVSIYLHGPAGTVQLLWQKMSARSEDLIRFAAIQFPWYDRLSIEWHSRRKIDSECHTNDCQVFANGPNGPGACWHEADMISGQQLGPMIESGCWSALSEYMETFYRDWAGG